MQEDRVDLNSQSAKSKRPALQGDEPTQQSMRQGTKPVQRRAPSTDQKKVRRAMQRKAAEVVPERPVLQCQACGCRATSAPCGACGSILVQADILDRLVDRFHRRSPDTDFGEVQCPNCKSAVRPMIQDDQTVCTYCRNPLDKAAGKEVSCANCGTSGKSYDMAERSMGGMGTQHYCRDCLNPGQQRFESAMRKGAPFADYKDFAECVRKNKDKDDPEAYCGKIKHQVEDSKKESSLIRLSERDEAAYQAEMHRLATQHQVNVATSDGRINLQRGDNIRMPTGQTLQVNDVRRHESSSDHYYVDTDAGTSVVPWSTQFEVVPSNQRQQSIPGYGVPGGNTNALPFDPQNRGTTNQPSSQSATPDTCPVCAAKGALHRQGDKFVCSRCGYQQNYMGGGSGDMAFSDSPQTIQNFQRGSSKDHRSAIAKRAATVLDQMKETAL